MYVYQRWWHSLCYRYTGVQIQMYHRLYLFLCVTDTQILTHTDVENFYVVDWYRELFLCVMGVWLRVLHTCMLCLISSGVTSFQVDWLGWVSCCIRELARARNWYLARSIALRKKKKKSRERKIVNAIAIGREEKLERHTSDGRSKIANTLEWREIKIIPRKNLIWD